MNLCIRELRAADDLSRLLSLCTAFFVEYEHHHSDFFDTEEFHEDHLSGRFQDSITSDSSRTIIALIDDVIVGYASIAVRSQPDFYKVKQVGTISGLMVDAAFRRSGVASRLLAAAKDWFQQRGVRYFTVYTAVANADALEFYRRSGMQPLQTTLLGEIAPGQG